MIGKKKYMGAITTAHLQSVLNDLRYKLWPYTGRYRSYDSRSLKYGDDFAWIHIYVFDGDDPAWGYVLTRETNHEPLKGNGRLLDSVKLFPNVKDSTNIAKGVMFKVVS